MIVSKHIGLVTLALCQLSMAERPPPIGKGECQTFYGRCGLSASITTSHETLTTTEDVNHTSTTTVIELHKVRYNTENGETEVETVTVPTLTVFETETISNAPVMRRSVEATASGINDPPIHRGGLRNMRSRPGSCVTAVACRTTKHEYKTRVVTRLVTTTETITQCSVKTQYKTRQQTRTVTVTVPSKATKTPKSHCSDA